MIFKFRKFWLCVIIIEKYELIKILVKFSRKKNIIKIVLYLYIIICCNKKIISSCVGYGEFFKFGYIFVVFKLGLVFW